MIAAMLHQPPVGAFIAIFISIGVVIFVVLRNKPDA